MRRRRGPVPVALAAALIAASGLAGCSAGSAGGAPSAESAAPAPNRSTATSAAPTAASPPVPTTAPPATAAPAAPSVRVVRTVATGLDSPWGIAFLPDGSALIGSRDTARVVRVTPAGRVTAVGTVPGVRSNGSSGGEAGLLGLALSPGFGRDRLVYAYLSTASDNRVVRMTYTGGRLGPPRPIRTGIPRGLHHNGGRLAFGPDGMLYVSTGESGDKALAQDRSSLGGKVLRMTPTGGVPSGNPFRGSLVWSYGHRNVEGLAFDGQGRLWASEFGDKAWDELNLIRRGRDYGWPATQGTTSRAGYTSPLAQWRTDDAGPSGVAVRDGVAWLGALTGRRLYRVQLTGARAGAYRAFLVGAFGRLRSVAFAPDGRLWVTTSNTDGRTTPRRGDDRVLVLEVH